MCVGVGVEKEKQASVCVSGCRCVSTTQVIPSRHTIHVIHTT